MPKKETTAPVKAVLYARYSSDRQREESIEGQIRVCEDYARLREKLLLRGAEGIAEFTAQARQVRDRLEVLERLYESVTREVATFHRELD